MGNLDFDKGLRPHRPIVGSKDGPIYVTTEDANSISIVDAKSMTGVGAIPTGAAESHMLALSHDGWHGYAANVGPGTVSVLDLVNRKRITTIPISKQTQRIAMTPDDKHVFTADQIPPRFAVIDTSTNRVASWIALPELGYCYGAAPTPDGQFLVGALPKAEKIAIVVIAKGKVVTTIDVPANPPMVGMQPDGKRAYVSCDVSGQWRFRSSRPHQ